MRSPCFYSCCLLLYSKQRIGEDFFSTNFVVIESFCVHIWELWVFINCVGWNLSLIHAFKKWLLKKYFIVIHLQLSAFSPHPSIPLQPNPSPSPVSTPPCCCPCVLCNCSCKLFTLFLFNPLPSLLCPLPACSQFQCLWLCLACLFVLLIRFLLKWKALFIKI